MILVVVAVPIVTVAVGQQADHLALRGAEAQQAQDHLVNAVLLQAAPATGIPDPYTSVQWAWVPARWQPPGRPARSGVVLAIARAPKGSTVQIWINAFGAVADPAGHTPYYLRTIGTGAWLGTIMLFNVWGIIWPNQKKILGIVAATDEQKAAARKAAGMASRVNFVLSIPMIMCMAGATHGLPFMGR